MSNLIIIGDDTPDHVLTPAGKMRGLIPRATFCGTEPEGIYSADEIPLVPWEQMPDRIADLERQKATLWHIWKDSKIGAKDQNGFGWCHAASCTDAVELKREAQGLPYVQLSIAGIAGPVTGYRDRGAYIFDDLDQSVKAGCPSTAFVPDLQLKRSGWKPGAEADGLKHRVTEWHKGQSRNVQQHLSLLLQIFPVCVGLNYWGHAVTDLRAVDYRPNLAADNWRRYAVDFLNSWTASYGENGVGRRVDSKMPADEFYSPREVTSSEA